MSEVASWKPLLGGSGSAADATRCELRTRVVRHVVYSPFPRVSSGQRERLGHTRDLSTSGLGLTVEAPVAPGSLLRLTLRSAEGADCAESIGRVAWSRALPDGRVRLGLALVSSRKATAQAA